MTSIAVALSLLLIGLLFPAPVEACSFDEVTADNPTGWVGCARYGEGTASMWPGPGVARNDCEWPWDSCQTISIQSLQTGITIIVTPSMYCDCYTGTANERIVDLDPGAVAALGLRVEEGLWKVRVTAFPPPVLPDTRYTSMVGVSDESDTIPRGPGSLLTPECRGHCVGETPGVRR
jgi:hypothetical protein